MYNIKNLKDRTQLLRDAADIDNCPVDAVCDSIPFIVSHVEELESIIVQLKKEKQKVEADLKDALRRNNNLNSQKVRHLKKKGKY
ncbi:MAG: hypothetical protein RL662_2387 [Bacteroidota bacterium]|jgi:hypothetical protein